MQVSSLLVQEDEQAEGGGAGGSGFEWKSQKGIGYNIPLILQEFTINQNLRPLNVLIVSNPKFN